MKAENRGRPVGGLRMQVVSYLDSRSRPITVETDKRGVAFFRGVRPGSYLLSADHDVGGPDTVALEVKLNGPMDLTIPLKWPNLAPVTVRSLKGTIRLPDYLPGQHQPMFSIDLLDGVSGRTLKTSQATDRGKFDFEFGTPGLYFLRLKPFPASGVGGHVAVTVDSDAPADHLDLDFGWTSCGLWYANQTSCSQTDLRLGHLSGQVLDITGASLPNAGIFVFDSEEALVEQLQSDAEGRFASTHLRAGTYQLLVNMAGFTPLRSTLHVETTGHSVNSSPITVQLGVSGACSAVVPR